MVASFKKKQKVGIKKSVLLNINIFKVKKLKKVLLEGRVWEILNIRGPETNNFLRLANI